MFLHLELKEAAVALLDILIVTYIVYRVLLIIRGTRAQPMLWGLVVVALLYFLSRWLGLVALNWLLGTFLSSIILLIVVLFQDEIRRALTKVGNRRFHLPRFSRKSQTGSLVDEIIAVSFKLASQNTGAIIVIKQNVGLEGLIEEGITIDSLLSRRLLFAIFLKDSPLHDGAVVIEDGRIKAAGCVLPLTNNPDLDPSLGTRHRAALGLSEQSDAVIIVVSEENGSVSLALDGHLLRNLDEERLATELTGRV
ncbi:MAG TPA: diadenylate cyclase CdaA [Oligoflexia bacterium]|nr:diadenylate cyclase CdaA [Oligoflexia bacterium]HMP27618.1 diadenylate cyclase CdaA [Oligoflexia bacterium]